MISGVQKLFRRLTGDRSLEPGHVVVHLPQSAGAPTDETMKVEVEQPLSLEHGKAQILPKGAVLVKAPKYPEAERIAASIRDFPEDWVWKMKGYELGHVPTGFILWVANQDYGLAEVYSTGGKGAFAKAEQAIIWPAVEGWLAQHKIGFTGRLPKVTIIGRQSTYWCFVKDNPWVGIGSSPADAYRTWSFAVSAQSRNNISANEYLEVRSATL